MTRLSIFVVTLTKESETDESQFKSLGKYPTNFFHDSHQEREIRDRMESTFLGLSLSSIRTCTIRASSAFTFIQVSFFFLEELMLQQGKPKDSSLYS